jgi:hypothetical protein
MAYRGSRPPPFLGVFHGVFSMVKRVILAWDQLFKKRTPIHHPVTGFSTLDSTHVQVQRGGTLQGSELHRTKPTPTFFFVLLPLSSPSLVVSWYRPRRRRVKVTEDFLGLFLLMGRPAGSGVGGGAPTQQLFQVVLLVSVKSIT